MKKIYFLLTLAFAAVNYDHGHAQCTLSLSTTASTVCAGDNVTLTANATPPVTAMSLQSTFAAGNNHRGNMFDITAANTVTITSFDAHPMGNTTIAIYYKSGTYVGSENAPANWTLIGSAAVTAQPTGIPTPVPVTVNVTIPAGQTYGFYVTSTNTAVSLNYTDGTAVGNTYASDANIAFKEGCGMEYPFTAGTGSFFTPRVWNGIIHYSVPTNPTYTYAWSTTETTQSINPTVNSTSTYSVSVDVSGCPTTLTGSVTVTVSTPPVNAGTDVTVCAGTPVTLSGSGAVSYTWDNSVTDGVAFTPTSTATYNVTGTDSIGCTATDNVVVTVNTVNVATSVLNETITALASGAAYQWMDCTTNAIIPLATNQSFTATSNGSYAVIVTENSCVDTSACEQIISTGMDQQHITNGISVYPVPANDNVIISSGNEIADLITIFDVTGKTVKEIKPSSVETTVSVSGMPAGIYFAQIKVNGALVSRKLIVQ
ncbi:MAG TPA: T9SS type A sorting domain-containing protein [Bacteroidia bacterium]|jgi:hypothetical protein|nr:T9SS type A sorting domain-containing protein [Bacteroidia bacterium]